jgi:hypothetical protein
MNQAETLVPKYYLGIDPGGSSGAWAVLDEHKNIIATGLWPELPSFNHITLACLELVHSMPKQGVSSAFAFGENLGFWKGALTVSKTPYVNITPQHWQKEVLDNIPASESKVKGESISEASRRRAGNTARMKAAVVGFVQRSIPASVELLKLKKSWGIADAICMALFAIKHDRYDLRKVPSLLEKMKEVDNNLMKEINDDL